MCRVLTIGTTTFEYLCIMRIVVVSSRTLRHVLDFSPSIFCEILINQPVSDPTAKDQAAPVSLLTFESPLHSLVHVMTESYTLDTLTYVCNSYKKPLYAFAI